MATSHAIMLLGLVTLAIAAVPVPAATTDTATLPIYVQVSVDKASITVGDLIRYTISVNAASNVPFALPQFAENLGGFAVSDWLRGEPSVGKDGRVHQAHTYVMETYLTGMYEIPPARVIYELNGATNVIMSTPIVVEVKSVAAADDLFKGIRDIKGPVALIETARTPWYIWGIGGALLLALLSGIAVVAARWWHQPAPPPPPVPAHIIAYAALRELFAQNLVARGLIMPYYFALSTILRRYIENRFGLQAPEQTTEEFLASLRTGTTLVQQYQTLLSEFLNECDMVKFANYAAGADDAQHAHDRAVRFIEETREHANAPPQH